MPPRNIQDRDSSAIPRHPPAFPLARRCLRWTIRPMCHLCPDEEASAASGELRLTVEEGVWAKYRGQIPAVDTEQAGGTEWTRSDLGIHNSDQGLPVVPGIATDMRQTIPCGEIGVVQKSLAPGYTE